jgi:hypothetical protein
MLLSPVREAVSVVERIANESEYPVFEPVVKKILPHRIVGQTFLLAVSDSKWISKRAARRLVFESQQLMRSS